MGAFLCCLSGLGIVSYEIRCQWSDCYRNEMCLVLNHRKYSTWRLIVRNFALMGNGISHPIMLAQECLKYKTCAELVYSKFFM